MFAFLPAYFVGGAALIIVGAIHLMFSLLHPLFFSEAYRLAKSTLDTSVGVVGLGMVFPSIKTLAAAYGNLSWANSNDMVNSVH